MRTINHYQQRYYYQEPHHHHGHHHHQNNCPKPCPIPCPTPKPTPKPTAKPTPKPTECNGVNKNGPFKSDLFALSWLHSSDLGYKGFRKTENFFLDFNDDGTITDTTFQKRYDPEDPDNDLVTTFDGFYVESLNELSFKWYDEEGPADEYFSFEFKWNYVTHQYEGTYYNSDLDPHKKAFAALKPAKRIDCNDGKLEPVDNICDAEEINCCISEIHCKGSLLCEIALGKCVPEMHLYEGFNVG